MFLGQTYEMKTLDEKTTSLKVNNVILPYTHSSSGSPSYDLLYL